MSLGMERRVYSYILGLTVSGVEEESMVVVDSLRRLEASDLDDVVTAGAMAVAKPKEGEGYLGSITDVGNAGGRPVMGSLKRHPLLITT